MKSNATWSFRHPLLTTVDFTKQQPDLGAFPSGKRLQFANWKTITYPMTDPCMVYILTLGYIDGKC